jgi:hypothetical protein
MHAAPPKCTNQCLMFVLMLERKCEAQRRGKKEKKKEA